MSSTNKTTHYELPQYVENDIFNPLVDDNDAYSKIDTALYNIADAEADDAAEIVGIKSRLDTAEGKVEALEAQNGVEVLTTTAQTLSGAVNELDGDTSSLDGRLDVVEDDINNENTGLKAKVASLGTRMTTAEGDIDALEAQNGVEVLKTIAQTLSGAVNENFDKIASYNSITTPEMFGAVGDGVTDDTVAIQNAIDNGKLCVMNNSYKTTQPIVINRKTVILNGSISYSGVAGAIHLQNNPVLMGRGSVVSDGAYAISNNLQPLRRAIVKGLSVYCNVEGSSVILLESTSGDNSVTNNSFEHLQIFGGEDSDYLADNGIYLHSSLEGFINENYYEQIRFDHEKFGIKMYSEGTYGMNRNQFSCTTENTQKTLYAKSESARIMDNKFDFRTPEIVQKTDQIQIDSHFIRNLLYGQYKPNMFTSLENTTASMYTSYTTHANEIIGEANYDSGQETFINPTFLVNGNVVMFNFLTAYRSAALGGDGVNSVTLDYSGDNTKSAGYKILRVTSSQTALTIDLNNRSNGQFSPIHFIEVRNSNGTDITIVNGSDTVFATQHLAVGMHEFMYVAPTEIALLS